MKQVLPVLVYALLTLVRADADAVDVVVRDAEGFRRAVAAAGPGTRVLLAEGVYGGGFHFANLRGEAGRPVIIAALDAQRPPVFRDADVGVHLSNPAHVELRDLVFTRLARNGLNLDDVGGPGGEEGAHHVTLHGLRITDIGAEGNHDGIKLSGVWDFSVRACVIERWGTRGGSAIDLVGCHRGSIEENEFRHTTPAPPDCSGVQAKGGSGAIAILRNRFEHAGGRAVNLGGSTGRAFFRPALSEGGGHAEARDLRVERNEFVGGVTPVAFVGVDRAVVRFNTIERPGRWVARILQETRDADFVACRGGEFTDNLILYEGNRTAAPLVNVGAGTAPETFIFARNAWLNLDDPASSRPALPVPETGGHYDLPLNEAAIMAGAAARVDITAP
jgi:hypothetical protein